MALLRFHLKYEADLLFTRWAGTPGPQARGVTGGVRLRGAGRLVGPEVQEPGPSAEGL